MLKEEECGYVGFKGKDLVSFVSLKFRQNAYSFLIIHYIYQSHICILSNIHSVHVI